MKIFPAIDIKGGKCVRLLKGDFANLTQYDKSPLNQANTFVNFGFKYLHLIDLDGALEGRLTNKNIIQNIAKINKLYDEGWHIVYWTARGGSEKSRKNGKCYYDFTWKQLESWGCKFHDLSTGTKGQYQKPPYDLVVDDKAKRIEEL